MWESCPPPASHSTISRRSVLRVAPCASPAPPPAALSSLLLRAYTAAAAALAALVAAECYFTARYFHPPLEILLGAALGAALFQLPLVAYTRWAARQVAGSIAGAGGRQEAQTGGEAELAPATGDAED